MNTEEKAIHNTRPETVRTHISRRERRAHVHNINPRNNDGSLKNSKSMQMMKAWDDAAIYTPQRKKLKGYEKENRRYNRKTA